MDSPPPPPPLRQPPLSIEDLPSGAIEYILTRMPIRDAVRTSILSPDWRHRWKSIPDINFGNDYNLPISAIDTVLNHHSSFPIRSFSLLFFPNNMTVSDTDRWLLSLSHPDSLSSLTLHFHFVAGSRPPPSCHPLQSSLFSFRYLQSLTLFYCSIPDSSSFFPLLKELDLQFVQFPDDQFVHRFISNSPMLTYLKLHSVSPSPRKLAIANPNLRWFWFFYGREECNSIIFTAGQALDMVTIFPSRDDEKFDLSQSFPNGASCNGTLHLSNIIIKGLANRYIPKSILNGFQNLAVLSTHIDFASAEQIMLLLCLMRSAPNLKRIRFSGVCIRRSQLISLDKDFWKENPMGHLRHLRTVELQLLSNLGEPMVDFVLGVLEKANRLEKLLISDCYYQSSSDDPTIKRIRNYPRASPQAEIIYLQGEN